MLYLESRSERSKGVRIQMTDQWRTSDVIRRIRNWGGHEISLKQGYNDKMRENIYNQLVWKSGEVKKQGKGHAAKWGGSERGERSIHDQSARSFRRFRPFGVRLPRRATAACFDRCCSAAWRNSKSNPLSVMPSHETRLQWIPDHFSTVIPLIQL